MFLQLHHRRLRLVVLQSVVGHHVRTNGTVGNCVCFHNVLRVAHVVTTPAESTTRSLTITFQPNLSQSTLLMNLVNG